MSDLGDCRIYPWQKSYQDALLELDHAELRRKVDRAVSELEKRSRELMLSDAEECFPERQAIVDALNGLDAIQKHELVTPFDSRGEMRPIST